MGAFQGRLLACSPEIVDWILSNIDYFISLAVSGFAMISLREGDHSVGVFFTLISALSWYVFIQRLNSLDRQASERIDRNLERFNAETQAENDQAQIDDLKT